MSETQKGNETLKVPPIYKNELDYFITQNHNLIYSFLRHHNLNIEDYYDIVAIGLVKAAQTFQEEKSSKFSSYAYFVMWNEIKSEWRKNSAQHREIQKYLISYNQNIKNNNEDGKTILLDCLPNINCNVENEIIIKTVVENFVKKIKNPNHKKIFYMHISGYKQREIAEEINQTQSNVNRIIKDLLQKLKKELDIKQ